jgi:CRP-like cAMP-binding protein
MTESEIIFNEFFDFIDKLVPFSSDEKDTFRRKISIKKYKKGEIIIQQGLKSNYLFYIHKGIIRYFLDNETIKNKTYNFRCEGKTLTAYSTYNYYDGFKSKLSVECLEECTLVTIPVDTLQYVVENFDYGDRLGRYLAEIHVLELVDTILDRDCKSIMERYEDLDKKFPNINQRVSQHYIASYLGTTPVHLSRLKKNRKISS